jgi:pimeloyl-ACP methyl ester carboxylesterase
VLAMAGGAGVLIGWMVSRQGDIRPVVVPANSNLPVLAIAQAAPETKVVSNPSRPRTPAPAPPPPPQEEAFPAWEKQLDNVLISGDDVNTKADRILALIPTAPTNAQVELAQHLVNMTQDDHYDGTAQMLTNASTSAPVSQVLMNDLLNRNNNIKLPMLLAVARQDDHPLKGQAREMLELLIQEDDGTNWDQWNTSIDTWLQNNQ